MKLTIQWLAVALLALSTSGCFWLLTGGDKGKFPEGTYRELEDGRIEVTRKVTPIEGITLDEGAIVSFSMGTLTTIETAQPLALNNAKVPAGSIIKFRKRGAHLWMASATLGETVSYGSLEFRKGTVLTFDDEGTPNYAMLKGKHTFEGEQYRTKTQVWFEDGEVIRSKTLAERDAERADRARERRRCNANCAPFTGAARARCINAC